MGELRLIKADGTEITFRRDGGVVHSYIRMEVCDQCQTALPESEGTSFKDGDDLIAWLCAQCVMAGKNETF